MPTLPHAKWIAQGYLKMGEFEKAIETTIERHNLKGIGHDYDYVIGFYILGQAYEAKGDKNKAIENYEKFLEIWKDADDDLPDLIDARKRLANLEGSGGI